MTREPPWYTGNPEDEITRLNAEVERLSLTLAPMADEIERLEAEIERLKADMARQQKVYHETQWHQLQETRADNARLRAALQAMVKHFRQYEDAECCKRCLAQARAALEPEP